MALDDLTGVEDQRKQDPLDSILFNINQMYEYGTDADTVSLDLDNVSLQDVDRYLKKVERNQDTPIKLFTVNFAGLYSPNEAPQIIDEAFVNLAEYPNIQNVYFLEGGKFALALFPIIVENKKLCVIIQPLEQSLPFVKREYYKVVEQRHNKRKTVEELKEQISFIKFPKQK